MKTVVLMLGVASLALFGCTKTKTTDLRVIESMYRACYEDGVAEVLKVTRERVRQLAQRVRVESIWEDGDVSQGR